jgi:hypothetical protein
MEEEKLMVPERTFWFKRGEVTGNVTKSTSHPILIGLFTQGHSDEYISQRNK